MIGSFKNKRAIAVCCIWYYNQGNIQIFSWEVKWIISDYPKWENWFWWDKIFIPDWFNKTFAEMTQEEKNSISMRRIVFEKLAEAINLNK